LNEKSDKLISFRPTGISEKYQKFPFATRRNAITDEYEVSKESLGVGINGKVLTCTHRETKRKCALKVRFLFIGILFTSFGMFRS
jgi:hypothetical protein